MTQSAATGVAVAGPGDNADVRRECLFGFLGSGAAAADTGRALAARGPRSGLYLSSGHIGTVRKETMAPSL